MTEENIHEALFIMGQDQHGQRLDKALEAFLPGLSVRARRRLWDTAHILVNGRAAARGFSVIEGDEVRLVPHSPDTEAEKKPHDAPPYVSTPLSLNDTPRFLQQEGDLLFFYKPAGMHSTALPGTGADRGGICLESILPELLSQAGLTLAAMTPKLCTRLDQGTSGIVVATRTTEALKNWRRMEDAGLCHKRYVALVHGIMKAPFTAPNALDTDHRKVSRVLPALAPSLRHTHFAPLGEADAESLTALSVYFPTLAQISLGSPDEALSFAACTIAKGARHQIRAHAAHGGFPLWGDARYTRSFVCTEGESFVLHHGALSMPGMHICCPPFWQTQQAEKTEQKRLSRKIDNNITLWLQEDV